MPGRGEREGAKLIDHVGVDMISVAPFPDADEAVAWASAPDFGLASSAPSTSVGQARFAAVTGFPSVVTELRSILVLM